MNKEKLHKFRRRLGWCVFFGGMVLDVFVSCWLLFLKPFLNIIFVSAAGAFTLKLLGITILKFIFAPFVWYGLLLLIEFCAGYLGDY